MFCLKELSHSGVKGTIPERHHQVCYIFRRIFCGLRYCKVKPLLPSYFSSALVGLSQ